MRDPRAPGRAPAPACLRHFRTCSPYLEPVLPLGWQGGRGLRAPHFHPGRWFEAWLRPGARSTFAGSWSWLGGRAGGTLLLEHGCWSTLFSCPHQLTTQYRWWVVTGCWSMVSGQVGLGRCGGGRLWTRQKSRGRF